jgi:hypothetical protein
MARPRRLPLLHLPGRSRHPDSQPLLDASDRLRRLRSVWQCQLHGSPGELLGRLGRRSRGPLEHAARSRHAAVFTRQDGRPRRLSAGRLFHLRIFLQVPDWIQHPCRCHGSVLAQQHPLRPRSADPRLATLGQLLLGQLRWRHQRVRGFPVGCPHTRRILAHHEWVADPRPAAGRHRHR